MTNHKRMNRRKISTYKDWFSGGRLIRIAVVRLRCVIIVLILRKMFLDFSSVFVLRLILSHSVL